MDGWKDGWGMDRWMMDRWMDGRMDEVWIDGWMDLRAWSNRTNMAHSLNEWKKCVNWSFKSNYGTLLSTSFRGKKTDNTDSSSYIVFLRLIAGPCKRSRITDASCWASQTFQTAGVWISTLSFQFIKEVFIQETDHRKPQPLITDRQYFHLS